MQLRKKAKRRSNASGEGLSEMVKHSLESAADSVTQPAHALYCDRLLASQYLVVISTEQSQGHHQEHQAVTCQGGNQAATAHVNLRLTPFTNVLHKCHIPGRPRADHFIRSEKRRGMCELITITYLVIKSSVIKS